MLLCVCVCVCQFPAESQVNNNSTQNSLTEEQRAEAETLKTDGKMAMKETLLHCFSQT